MNKNATKGIQCVEGKERGFNLNAFNIRWVGLEEKLQDLVAME
jgi:hypothetical protein